MGGDARVRRSPLCVRRDRRKPSGTHAGRFAHDAWRTTSFAMVAHASDIDVGGRPVAGTRARTIRPRVESPARMAFHPHDRVAEVAKTRSAHVPRPMAPGTVGRLHRDPSWLLGREMIGPRSKRNTSC